MRQETHTCQNCKNQFVIEPEDFVFYEKMQVPPPTFCSECRLQRRLMFRSETALYWRECALCRKRVLSMFSSDKPYAVYCQPCWWSDKWDPLAYGKEYDFSKPFFEQFKELSLAIPYPALVTDYLTLENSEYANQVDHLKNCYLFFNGAYNESCFYSYALNRCKEVFDSLNLDKCELCYECYRTHQSYSSAYLSHSRTCIDSLFLRDCADCQKCIGCFGLRGRQHHIFNQPYSPEEHANKVKELDLGSYRNLTAFKERFRQFVLKHPIKAIYSRITNNVSGNYIYESRNCASCFSVTGAQDGKYVFSMETPPVKDVMDYTVWGDNAELIYECETCGDGVRSLRFCRNCWGEFRDSQYTWESHNAASLFGCVGLRSKQFCILNKRYTENEYNALVPKIIEHMNAMPYKDKKGIIYKYGEFFPAELSPCAYNETMAQEYFPLNKERTIELGHVWKDSEGRQYGIIKKATDLPDHIRDIDDSILKEVIGCAHEGKCEERCATAFKIIPQELQFYRKMNLPLPRLCFNCRHSERIQQRTPLKLWPRECQCNGKTSENAAYANNTLHFHGENKCPNEFKTSYPPESPEIIYCEQCYNSEVV